MTVESVIAPTLAVDAETTPAKTDKPLAVSGIKAFFGTLKRSKKDASAKVAERAEEVATQEVATTEEIEKVANAVKEEADAVVPEVVVTNSEGKTEEPVEVAVSEPTEVTEVKESETPEEPTELTPIEETVKEEEAVVAEKPAAAKKPFFSFLTLSRSKKTVATQESEKEAFVQAKEAQEHEVMDASSPDAAKDVTEADKVQDEEGAEPKEAETTDESGDVGALMDLGEKKSMDEERPATVLTPEKKSIKAFFKSLTKKRVVLADAAVATEEPVEEPKKKDGEEDEESKSTTSDQGTQVESTESDSEKVDAAVDSAVATKEIDTQTEKVTKKNFFAMFKPSSTPTKKAPAIASA